MPGHDIIVVGASAGGVEVLSQLVRDLPANLPAALFVVLHIPAQSPSVLPSILNRAIRKRQPNSPLQALHPKDGEAIAHGRIYVAPPDQHLLIKDGHIHLARGPKENGLRPAVDPLFRTAARIYGQRVIGVVLSGTLDDGTAGLAAVKQQGGVAIVQDPEEALYSGMPQSAIENVEVDYILPISEIAPVLVQLAEKPVEPEGVKAVSDDMKIEADMAELEIGAMQSYDCPGTPSGFACPDCGGVLWELGEQGLVRFRCRTGHAYSSNSLMAAQSEALEEALWNALRALEEKAALVHRLGERARDRHQAISAKHFEQEAQAAQQRAALIRKMLLKSEENGNLSTLDGQVVEPQGLLKSEERNGSQETEDKEDQDISSPSPLAPRPSPLHMVAICASAGGLNALSQVLSGLPADFPVAITVVQHLSSQFPSLLAEILSRRIKVRVKQAESGDLLLPGTVFVAPSDQHLLVNLDSTLSLSHSELVHFVRPSADLLFESAAASFEQQAIAVILTGKGSDGAMGVRAIKKMGGTVIAQDQATSEFFGMPEAAINTGVVDLVVPLNEIAATLVNLVTVKDEG
ncbi:chemotaxis protein CheB [Chroococcidiopsis sp. CCMEE 29]|uniref:chemotaxis protein CheB n=1 Tax=Chroococcidiopsis sp. CCMEE 29 TaxID=155894 RepID=UPI002021A902|nr:chemotaxis protein CheB [Chroococcidiopsis sp. CCMEE 29]